MEPLYIALDFPTWEESKVFLEENELDNVGVKVGMELFYREGVQVIEQLKLRNHPVFLDLKLHDIPTTVMKAMRNLAALEVDIVNVHALGGNKMIQKAKEGLQSSSDSRHETKLIAVTILTSMDESSMQKELGLEGSLTDHAIHLAKESSESGADGVVCSVHEALAIKEACGEQFSTVTPGIRLKDSEKDDQHRIATPGFAKQNGSDCIVVGRSITQAEKPLTAYHQVMEEWEND